MAGFPWFWRKGFVEESPVGGPRVHNPNSRPGYGPQGEANPPSVERVRAMYRREPSFTNLLPWLDFNDGIFLS